MTKTIIASFDRLSEAKTIDEVLDYLVYRTSSVIIDQAVFDHLLFRFFSTLPEFDHRNDYSEEEVETFKQQLPYQEFGVDGKRVLTITKRFRSVNRVLDTIVSLMPKENKLELAREYFYKFWYEKTFGSDLKKFVSALKKEFWNKQDESLSTSAAENPAFVMETASEKISPRKGIE
jgi:hypothetical protein